MMWDEGLDYPELAAMGGGRYGINVVPCDSHGRPYDPADPMDDNHHGTHVAGIIAAGWNNSWHDSVYGETMDKLVREAGGLGIISVFAAGNRALNIDNKDLLQDSFYNNPYVVIVGVTVSEEGGFVFAGTDVKTKTQYGDVVRITVSSSEGGSVSREGCIKSYAGAKETFLPVPEEGYKVGSITVDGKELPGKEAEKAAKSGYIFNDLTEDHEMHVSFVK